MKYLQIAAVLVFFVLLLSGTALARCESGSRCVSCKSAGSSCSGTGTGGLNAKISPGSITVKKGESASFTITVENTKGSSDVVLLTSEGSTTADDLLARQAAFSKGALSDYPLTAAKISVPASSSVSTKLTVSPKASLEAGTYYLDIGVLSQSQQGNYGGIYIADVEVDVLDGSTGLAGNYFLLNNPVVSGQKKGTFALSVYYNTKIVTGKGYVVKSADSICDSDTCSVSLTPSAEFFSLGGPTDTPPVIIVPDLQEALRNIDSMNIKTYGLAVCNYRYACLDDDMESCRCILDAAVLCESPCTVSASGKVTKVSDNIFKAKASGTIGLSMSCELSCAMYYSNGDYGLIDFPDGNVVALSNQININLVNQSLKPDLRITNYTYNYLGDTGKTMIRLMIENRGAVWASLDNISTNLPSNRYSVLYKPSGVSPGSAEEVLIEADLQGENNLRVGFDYSASSQGCLASRHFEGEYAVGGCGADSDCDDGSECTDDRCIDAGSPDAYCMNTPYCLGTDDSCGCNACADCRLNNTNTLLCGGCLDSKTILFNNITYSNYCSGYSCGVLPVVQQVTASCDLEIGYCNRSNCACSKVRIQ